MELVACALHDDGPSGTWFSDRLVGACSPAYLPSALHARERASLVGADALRVSLDLDPVQTPIGEIPGVG